MKQFTVTFSNIINEIIIETTDFEICGTIFLNESVHGPYMIFFFCANIAFLIYPIILKKYSWTVYFFLDTSRYPLRTQTLCLNY